MITNKTLEQYAEYKSGVYEIEKSFTIEVVDCNPQCTILNMVASYSGNEIPTIQFLLFVKEQEEALYESQVYSIGKSGEIKCQSWRIPPMMFADMKLKINVTIPDKTVLKVRSISAEHSSEVKRYDCGMRHNAHLGFFSMAPANTMPAYELAAQCGFPACIVNPKRTKDGVFVCLHDDTINGTARDENGQPPKEELFVSDMTYEEVSKWDFGISKSIVYKGTKIPLLDDFFTLCEKTGMYPMFSVHPDFTDEQWLEIKEMLIKHGLLNKLSVKSDELDVLEHLHKIFKDEIDEYIWYVEGWNESYIDKILSLGIDPKKQKLVLELRFHTYTKEMAQKIRDKGMIASSWDVLKADSEKYRELISYGVTEFTEDVHCSMGLNW